MNYQKIYEKLIQKCKSRTLVETYYEVHHIVPRCIGGTNDPTNLVKMLPEEHVIAHLLLVKIYPLNYKLVYAANMMTNRVKNNKEYAWIKQKFSNREKEMKTGYRRSSSSIEKQRQTILNKYKNGYKSPSIGRTLSLCHKQAISNANKNKHVPEKSKSNIAGYIIRYGDELGKRNYLEDCKKKDSHSLEFYINKYGLKTGSDKYLEFTRTLSENMSGKNNHFYGKSHSDETKYNISKSKTGKKISRSSAHNKKIGDANRGKSHDIICCPYCNKEGGKSIMKRWHFDNCKLKDSG